MPLGTINSRREEQRVMEIASPDSRLTARQAAGRTAVIPGASRKTAEAQRIFDLGLLGTRKEHGI